jgi:hypothetical protein
VSIIELTSGQFGGADGCDMRGCGILLICDQRRSANGSNGILNDQILVPGAGGNSDN